MSSSKSWGCKGQAIKRGKLVKVTPGGHTGQGIRVQRSSTGLYRSRVGGGECLKRDARRGI